MDRKRELGRWLTRGDPFYADAFAEWMRTVMASSNGIVSACEPYAGELSLVGHLRARMPDAAVRWSAYDIAPPSSLAPEVSDIRVDRADTLLSIPRSPYNLIITNPPYLARNSASRRHIPFDDGGDATMADLYQVALSTCLRSADYVAVIIPESFLTSGFDKSRCSHVISLRAGLFPDTECPVCLALFNPIATDDVTVHANDGSVLGTLSGISAASSDLIGDRAAVPFVMNDPHGDVGLMACDSNRGPSVSFVDGDRIDPSGIKVSSRAVTRMSRRDGAPVSAAQIRAANAILSEWRETTGDVLMTAFKGVRTDGRYRRRLSFHHAELIMSRACSMA